MKPLSPRPRIHCAGALHVERNAHPQDTSHRVGNENHAQFPGSADQPVILGRAPESLKVESKAFVILAERLNGGLAAQDLVLPESRR